MDLRSSLRGLLKTPGFTALALTVLALGLAVNSAVFSLVNAVLLRPLPYTDPSQLVALDEYAPKRGIESMGTAFPNFLDYRAGNRVFQDVAAYFLAQPTLGADGSLAAERVRGARVSYSLFELLGVRPLRGRSFRADEDRHGASGAVILGYDLWQRRYGGDDSVVGRPIRMDGRPVTIVGVMPPGFRFPEVAQIWSPLSLDPADATRTDHFMQSIARLKPGVSLAQAQADMDVQMQRLAERHSLSNADQRIRVIVLRNRLVGDYRNALLSLVGAVVFVLLIACANVAARIRSSVSLETSEVRTVSPAVEGWIASPVPPSICLPLNFRRTR